MIPSSIPGDEGAYFKRFEQSVMMFFSSFSIYRFMCTPFTMVFETSTIDMVGGSRHPSQAWQTASSFWRRRMTCRNSPPRCGLLQSYRQSGRQKSFAPVVFDGYFKVGLLTWHYLRGRSWRMPWCRKGILVAILIQYSKVDTFIPFLSQKTAIDRLETR